MVKFVKAVGAGLFIWAAFPPLSYWPALLVGLVLLLSFVSRPRRKIAGLVARKNPTHLFKWGFVAGLAFFIPHIHWIFISTDSYFMWLLLAAIQALFWGLFLKLAGFISGWPVPKLLQYVGFALLWVGLEQLRGFFPFTGFPWGFLAYPLVDSPWRFWAPFGGEVLLGFLTVFTAACFLDAVTSLWRFVTFRGFTLIFRSIFMIVLAFFILFSAFFGNFLPASVKAGMPLSAGLGVLNVGIVQGNVAQPAKATYQIEREVFNNHLRESQLLRSRVQAGEYPFPDVIFWGENALDLDPFTDFKTRSLMLDEAHSWLVPIVAGQVSASGGVVENQMLVWYPNGSLGDVYAKQYPVPFGEYYPRFLDFWPFNQLLAYAVGDIRPGESAGLVSVKLADGRTVPVSLGICFEAAFQSVFREPVLAGAQLLVVPTNNSSFVDSFQAEQQFQMVRLRALEFNRFAVQVSTNGVSGVVSPVGFVRAKTGLNSAASLVVPVDLSAGVTYTALYGGVIQLVCVGFAGVVAGLAVFFGRGK